MATIKELIVKITTNAKKAKDDVKDFGKATEDVGKKSKTTAEGVGKLSKTETDLSTSATKATGETHKLKGKVEGLIAPVKDAGDALNVMKGALGAFGISAGVGELIKQFQKLADEIKDARDEYSNAKAELIDYNGELSQSQQDLIDSIYEMSEGKRYGFTDKSQVTKAVAYSSTYYPDASMEQLSAIATELSSLQAINAISDTASFATKAKESFTDWGISTGDVASSMDYLYQVAVQTKIPLENLMDFMTSNVDVLKELGYTFEESASMIGDSFSKTGSTKGMQEALDGYQDNVEKYMEIYTERESKMLAKMQIDTYTKTLNDSLPGVQSATEAWIDKLSEDTSLYLSTVDSTKRNQGVRNSSDPLNWYYSQNEAVNEIMGYAETTLGKPIGQIEALHWKDLLDYMSMEEVKDLMDKTGGQFELLNQEGLVPTDESLGFVLTSTQNLVDYVINTLIPNLGDEGEAVKNLVSYYWDLYKAKKAVAEV